MKINFLFQDLLGYWEMLKNYPSMMISLMFTPLPLGSGMWHTWIGYEWLHLKRLVLEWLRSDWRKMESFFFGFSPWVEWLFQRSPSFKLPIFVLTKLIGTKTIEQLLHKDVLCKLHVLFFLFHTNINIWNIFPIAFFLKNIS